MHFRSRFCADFCPLFGGVAWLQQLSPTPFDRSGAWVNSLGPCLKRPGRHGARMSLNRGEQVLCDYVESHPEERSFWVERVRRAAAQQPDRVGATRWLAEELQQYHAERLAMVPALAAQTTGGVLPRTSLMNLAEYWLRLWAEPKPAKRPLVRSETTETTG